MGFPMSHEAVVRYRGYLLLPQTNQSWLVRPERSPMQLSLIHISEPTRPY